MHLYVISRPTIEWSEVNRFLSDHATTWRRTAGAAPPDELVELAGRVCYFSFGTNQSNRSNEEYIANLIAHEHDSVLEHSVWTFILTGVSRAFTHQLVRHRVGISFSQLSQQYYDETAAEFVMPEQIRGFADLEEIWRGSVQTSLDAYRSIAQALQSEVPKAGSEQNMPGKSSEAIRAIRSAARSVLPNATETKILMTINARTLRHFLRIRGSIIGDLEMRIVSTELLKSVKNDAPSLFLDFQIETLSDGTPRVVWKGPAGGKE